MEEISKDIFFIPSHEICSNIYILKDRDVCIIIDTGDGRTEIKEKADYCFLTHGHGDHTGGLREDWNVFLRKEDFRTVFPFKVPSFVQPLKLDRLKVGSFELEFIHTPGHTEGSICILERRRNILFTGDTLFSDGWIGRTDLPGGNDKDMMNSLRMLLARFSNWEKIIIPFPMQELGLKLSILCPGHGEILHLR